MSNFPPGGEGFRAETDVRDAFVLRCNGRNGFGRISSILKQDFRKSDS